MAGLVPPQKHGKKNPRRPAEKPQKKKDPLGNAKLRLMQAGYVLIIGSQKKGQKIEKQVAKQNPALRVAPKILQDTHLTQSILLLR